MKDKKRLIIMVILFIVLLIGAKFGYGYLKDIYGTKNEIAEENTNVELAKDFSVYNKDGNKVNLSDFIGKKNIVINFWASWCPPCRSEMVHFQEATDKYVDKDIIILMINLTDGSRETQEKAINYLNEEGYSMNVVFDKDLDAASKNNVSGIPRTIFINKNGQITKDKMGVISEDELNSSIEELLRY